MNSSEKTRFSISKKGLILVGLLISLVVGFWYYQTTHQSNLETVQVTRETIEETLTVSGNVKPNGRIDVFASTNGVIQELYVENGQYVDKGQPLFAVVSTATAQEKAAAKAALTAAIQSRQAAQQEKLLVQSQLEAARQSILSAQVAVDSYENDLSGNESYTEAERERLYSQLTSARQAFSNAEKKYLEFDTKIAAASQDQQAKSLALDATTDQIVTAVLPGSVSNISYKVGDEVFIASDTRSESVLSLTDFNQYTVEVTVKENDIYKLKTGQEVDVALEAIDDTTFNGRIDTIDSLGEVNAGVVNYSVSVRLLETDDRIRPGMTANATVMIATYPEVLAIPNDFISKENQTTYIFVERNGRVEKIAVELGAKDGSFTEVVSGLGEDETIVKIVE